MASVLRQAASGLLDGLVPKQQQGLDSVINCGHCQQKLRIAVKSLFANHKLTILCPKCQSTTTIQLTYSTNPPPS